MADNRIIPTGLFSHTAEEILVNFFKHKSETSTNRMYRNTERVAVKVAPDGEILLEACLKNCRDAEGHYHYGSSIWDKNRNNDAKSKEWLAVAIKHHVIDATKSDGNWRRNNTEGVIEDFATKNEDGTIKFIPTVAWLYCIYDHLLGRKSLEKKYGIDLVKKVIGIRRDPMLTEMETNRRNEVKRINDEFEAAKKAANDKRDRLSSEYYQKLQAQADIEIKAAEATRDEALKRIEETMQKILAMHQS